MKGFNVSTNLITKIWISMRISHLETEMSQKAKLYKIL